MEWSGNIFSIQVIHKDYKKSLDKATLSLSEITMILLHFKNKQLNCKSEKISWLGVKKLLLKAKMYFYIIN
jgi:hypothetical protein